MVAEKFDNTCLIVLPGAGRLPRPIVMGILEALESPDKDSARLLIIDQETAPEAAKNAGTQEIGVQTILLKVADKVIDRVIDGATTVIRDQYRDDRAAKAYIEDKYSRPFWER